MVKEVKATLMASRAAVWDQRDRLLRHRQIPPAHVSLLFAGTELFEAVDAYLRTMKEYTRNSNRNMCELDELADCAMDLFTAIGRDSMPPLWMEQDWTDPTNPVKISHIWPNYVKDINQAISLELHARTNHLPPTHWHEVVWRMLERIATHPGMELTVRLQARLDQIEEKTLREAKEAQDASYA